MKRQKVIAMLLAGTLALSQPLTAFASDEGLVSDSTDENTVSEQIDAESESEGLIEDESSSEDMEQNSVEVSNEASLDTTEANDQSLSTDAFDDGSDEQIASDESNDADALTVAKNPSCQVTMSNGSKIDMEISNSGGEIPSDYNLDVRETVGDQKKNIEDEVNSAYGDKSKQNKKKEASAMFDLKVKDAQDNDIAFSDPSIITMSSTDFSFLNDSVLYHKKEDGSWEQLEYKQSSDGEKNVQYITFTVDDAYGTFVFSKEVENSKNDNKETDITNDEISDASEPEDSSEDLSVVKQINNFSWNGGILGHDMTIKVSSEASYPETSTLQVAEIPDDKIKAGIDAITKETGKKVAANSAVSINICKANGDVDSANGTYHINFAGVTVTDDTLLYHELNDNKWEAVSYQKSNSGVEFSSSNGLGNFVFLEPEKEESKEDRKDDTDKANTESNKTYSYEDDDVTITATANKDAGIPDGAELYAERLPEGTDAYNAAMSEIEDSVKVKDGQKLLYIPYDVYFVSNGKKIEPKSGKVEVKMEFKNALFGTSPKQDEAFIAHIKNDGTVEQIANSSKEKDTVEFDVDSFSIVGPAMVTEADEKDTASVQAIAPIIIDNFNASFVSGASLVNGKYVWNPSDPTSGHMFIYRIDYTMSGIFSTGKGAFKIEVPLHILKDRDGNWADTFDCPYRMESEITEMDSPDFVYSIDEKNNKATIYNYNPYPTGEAGYVEISYSTSKNTMNYIDMGGSTNVKAKVYATNAASTVTKEAKAKPVYIDTHATISYTQKKTPTLYTTWDTLWGTKPAGADDYLYLVWPIRSYINKNTALYNFYLNDTFTDLGGSVVGYKFAGQSGFTSINHVDNVSTYGDRYDYVLTRHSKAEAKKLLAKELRYDVHNNIVAKVDPVDQVDEDTTAASSQDWWYEMPRYYAPTGHFWAEKCGIYGNNTEVEDSEDISDYTLAEFCDGEEKTIDNIKYFTYGNAYPYPWTLADGAAGKVDDAINGLYGKKSVDYQFTDNVFYLENTKLDDKDYDLTKVEWYPTIRTAKFNQTSYTFEEQAIQTYKESDKIKVLARKDNTWKQVAVYNPQNRAYENIDSSYIKSASGSNINFVTGIKGVRFTASNAYYHTRFDVYPVVSLNRTANVLSIIGTDKRKVRLKNEADFVVTQNNSTLFARTVTGTDYIQKVIRESEIKKDVVQTKNQKRESRFDVTWRINFTEKYVDNDGLHYILQKSGKFYDLLPAGSILDKSSITVTAGNDILSIGDYSYEIVDNFNDSGRALLIVTIKNETKNKYILSYQTSHTYDSINDYGKNLLNSVAYESGNDKIGEGFPDDGGEITDKEYLKDLDKETNANKFKYAEARYNINFPVAASTGLKKQIKNSTAKQYSYETTVHLNEDYSYQVRLTNDASTKAKDIVFFDSLENFYQKAEETRPTKESDWKGTLTGINVNNLIFKNVSPAIYLSKADSINIQNHHDLTDTNIWIPYDSFVKTYGLSKATAIAVDAGKCTDGTDYVMKEKESISFDIYMKAPAEDKSKKTDPIAYNNIYVKRTALRDNGTDTEEIQQFYHQDYTKAHYRVSGNLYLRKVDATDMATPVKGITYKLTGTSGYGTSYEEERVSDKNGNMKFETIEKGTYTLQETACSDDWQLNTEAYKVTIGQNGDVVITNLTKNDDTYIVSDKPRIHADILFLKYNNVTNGMVEGAKFRLSGTSDYGNDCLMYATSNNTGRVDFTNVELGTYELVEVEAPSGYIPKKEPWKIKVDERGVAVIYDGNKEESKNTAGYYTLANEPYHSIRFVKSSTYGDNIYLEGAEFNLTGVSDYGTSVDKTAISGKAEDGGLVVFDRLEPGTYILKETKAPAEHDLNEKPYTVVVRKNGTFTIDGLEKVKFGSKAVSENIAENVQKAIAANKNIDSEETKEERKKDNLTENAKISTENDKNIMDELSKDTDTDEESSK